LPDQHPFYRKRFWYQCALIEFQYFREEAETVARNAVERIPRAAPLLKAQSFLAKSFDELSIQFWFGKHPTGRFYFDKSDKKQPATEDGAYLVYSVGPTGAVAVYLQAARSEVMEAKERLVLRHIGPLSCYQLCRRLHRDLRDLVAYNYATTLDGDPTLRERIRVAWIRFISLIEVKGEQYIPMNRVLFGGVGFLARTSVLALLRPWGILAMILIAAYFARPTMRANPAVLNGAPRSEVNTKGDLGSCSRCSRRSARNSSPSMG